MIFNISLFYALASKYYKANINNRGAKHFSNFIDSNIGIDALSCILDILNGTYNNLKPKYF